MLFIRRCFFKADIGKTVAAAVIVVERVRDSARFYPLQSLQFTGIF